MDLSSARERSDDHRGRDFWWMIVLVVILLFAPYLPRTSFFPVRIRPDNLLLPLFVILLLLRKGTGAFLALPVAGWRYFAFAGWLVGVSVFSLLAPVVIPAPAGLLAVLAGADAYIRPFFLLLIASNARIHLSGVMILFRVVLLASVPLSFLAYLQLQPWSEQEVNRFVWLFYNNGYFHSVEHLIKTLANRGNSIFIQFGTFAMYAVITLAVSMTALIGGRIFLSRVTAVLVGLAGVAGGLLSGSKVTIGAMAILLVGYALLTPMVRRLMKPQIFLGLLAGGVFFVLILPSFFHEERREFAMKAITDKLDPAQIYRVYISSRFDLAEQQNNDGLGKIWRTGAVDLFLERPFTGVGFKGINSTTDSFFFALLCMGGATGAALYLVMLYHLSAALYRQSRLPHDPTLAALNTSFFLLTLAFGVGSYGFHCLIQDRSGDLFWLIVGLLLGPLAGSCPKRPELIVCAESEAEVKK